MSIIRFGERYGKVGTVKRWTQTAVECYSRGCACNGCYYNDFFSGSQKCQMKSTVLELVRQFGKPDNVEPMQLIIN